MAPSNVSGILVHQDGTDNADDETLEACREKLETELNHATSRAYELTGNPE